MRYSDFTILDAVITRLESTSPDILNHGDGIGLGEVLVVEHAEVPSCGVGS